MQIADPMGFARAFRPCASNQGNRDLSDRRDDLMLPQRESELLHSKLFAFPSENLYTLNFMLAMKSMLVAFRKAQPKSYWRHSPSVMWSDVKFKDSRVTKTAGLDKYWLN
jgi:hypothetical protein